MVCCIIFNLNAANKSDERGKGAESMSFMESRTESHLFISTHGDDAEVLSFFFFFNTGVLLFAFL